MNSMTAGRVDGQMTGQVASLMDGNVDESLPCTRGAGPPELARPQTGTKEVWRGRFPCGRAPRAPLGLRLPCGAARRPGVRPPAVEGFARSGAVP